MEDSSHRTWAAAIAAERGQWDEVKDDDSMREILYPDGEAAHTCIMVSLSCWSSGELEIWMCDLTVYYCNVALHATR